MAKYCQWVSPIIKRGYSGQSLVWKQMMRNKFKVEPHIQWQIISGTSYFWWDNWLGTGPLAYQREGVSRSNNIRVSVFINHGE